MEQKNMKPGKFQGFEEDFKLLSRRVERLGEELRANTSDVVIKQELKLIKEQLKKFEDMIE